MRLFIAGGAPNSVRAIANLEAICREHLKGGHELEIIDVLEHPLRSMADSRGNIGILDRNGLEAAACKCYRIIKDMRF